MLAAMELPAIPTEVKPMAPRTKGAAPTVPPGIKTELRSTAEETLFTTLNSQAALKWLMHNTLAWLCVINVKVIHKCFPNVLPAPNVAAAAIVTETENDNKN